MKLFFFTSILWIPITNLVVTLYATKALRSLLFSPFIKKRADKGSAGNPAVTMLQ